MVDKTLNILMPVINRMGKGTYWRTYGFAQELAARGHAVTVLCAGGIDQEEIKVQRTGGVSQVIAPSRWSATQGSGYDPGDVLSRYRWLKQNAGRFDVVHAFESRPTSLVPAQMARRQGALFISDWCYWFGRGGSVEERTNILMRTLLRPVETVLENRSRPSADGVTVINETLRRKARSLGVVGERILVLPNGAYTNDFVPADRLAARKSLGLPLDDPIIAYTGSLFESGAELMVGAFNRIKDALPKASLLMIGYANIDLKPLVRYPQAVISTGPVSFRELVEYVAACTIGWIPLADSPANAGRFPMKLNDFMASGRAVVVTDVGDLGTVVRRHNLGLVAKPTPVDLANNVVALLGNPSKQATMEKQAREAAETTFAWSHVVDKLQQFYFDLIASRTTPL
jgi:glycosyltransferase involved in cell wall biosynthesis